METGKQHHWLRGLRPLAWWFVFVLILFAYHTHQRLSEKTFLRFSPSLEDRNVDFEAGAALDGQPFTSGARVSIGRHKLVISHEKAEPFSTNLFIWYGEHNLGEIALRRTKGTLAITANPPARLIDIRGPEFSLKLTNSAGITTSVPTDRYTVDVHYRNWQRTQQTTVYSTTPGTCTFAPRFGTAQLTCNQSGASFQMLNAREQLFESGEFPATIEEVPEGSYKLIAWHHDNKVQQLLTVKTGSTNNSEVLFLYGTALLETDPTGATVTRTDGRELGVTPLKIRELPVGRWQFQFRLNGYETALAALDIAAQQTNTFRTNLINISYAHSMSAARQFLATADYDRALRTASDALQVKPNDPEAVAVQKEALGKQHLRRAEALGKQGDYIGADKELELALQSLPENEEAKNLLANFKRLEPEQLNAQLQSQQLARMNRPKEELDKVMADEKGAALFETQEIRTGKKSSEVAVDLRQALAVQPKFAVTYDQSPAPDVIVIVAKQGGSAFARVCYLVIGQVTDTESQILFKVAEYTNESSGKDSLGAIFSAPGPAKYVLLRPNANGAWSQTQKNQIAEGIQMLTDRVRKAIGTISTQGQQP